MNIHEFKRIYLVGIKGVGMTALAQLLKSEDIEVLGSDINEKFFTDEVLSNNSIQFYDGFSKERILKDGENFDLFIYSTAYNEENNEEIQAIQSLGYPCKSYPEVISSIFNEKHGIAIAGSHGKTTTTAMLASIFHAAGLDPKALIGSKVPQFGGNALCGKSDYFILEADEYQEKLLKYIPKSFILTNIDWDHPDTYPSEKDYVQIFDKFLNSLSGDGKYIVCNDDSDIQNLIKKSNHEFITYGIVNQSDFMAKNIKVVKGKLCYDLFKNDENVGNVCLKVLGKHNVLNSLGSIAMSDAYGIDLDVCIKAIEAFEGTERRLQVKGEKDNVLIIDDYAHHPIEIKASLAALKEYYKNRNIICVFHPHTYSRTAALLDEFSLSFEDANEVVILDIYQSAREMTGGVKSMDLVQLINRNNVPAIYIATHDEVVDYLEGHVKSGDIVVTMGAGDVWKIGEQMLKK